jgi:hypothetical protein
MIAHMSVSSDQYTRAHASIARAGSSTSQYRQRIGWTVAQGAR